MDERFAGPLPLWITQHWLFAGPTPAELLPLVDATQQVRFSPGEVIFREGEPATGLYVLTVGSVRVAAVGAQGQTVLALVLAPGVFGEIGVLDGQPRVGTATAVGFCLAHHVPAAAFTAVLERSGPLGLRLLTHLARRLRRMNGRLLELPAGAGPVPAAAQEPAAQEPAAQEPAG
jgi:CRP-like cAMP-binding protein